MASVTACYQNSMKTAYAKKGRQNMANTNDIWQQRYNQLNDENKVKFLMYAKALLQEQEKEQAKDGTTCK